MDYYLRNQIPIVSFDEEPEYLDRELIRQALCEKPFNIVFVEVREKLYGIVSFGDVLRADKRRVPINRNFTYLEGKRFMKAREIFREKTNIREIPVVDAEGRLQGACSRNDDLLYLEYASVWEGNRYLDPFLRNLKTVRIVRPPQGDVRRWNIVNRWKAEFEKRGVSCEQIDFKDIPELQKEEKLILTADEETNLGAGVVMEALDGNAFRFEVVHSLRMFERLTHGHSYDELVKKLADFGIKIYNLYYTQKENTDGRRRLWQGMRDWLKRAEQEGPRRRVFPFCAQDFYGELNEGNYAAEVGNLSFSLETNNVYNRMKDVKGRYLNIENGERATVGQPSEADRVVWFFGPCLIIGNYVEDKHTIESFLQERLNREGYSCKVVNYGCYNETPYQEMIRLTSTPMKPGDVVVMHLGNRPIEGAESIDLTDVLDQNEVPTGWLLDQPIHCNHKVNQLYADYLFNRMVRDGALTKSVNEKERRSMLARNLAVNTLYLDLHFDDFHPREGETVGSVGMHGNPFTLGHRYLIETASTQVDRLFVLMIEDELGIFSYAERLAMAVEGTRDLPNVRIVPGGPFQATRNVFQDYFIKVEPSDMRESAVADTLIFTEVIAKRLGITRRFLGDERHNPKMQFFNDLMKEMAPKYGIDVIELPRAQAKGDSISASRSRRAAAEGDLETLRANLPESTLRILLGEDA